MQALKRYFFTRLLLTAVVGVALGVLLLVLRPYAREIFDILLIVMGLLTVVANLPPLVMSIASIKRPGEWINLAVAALSVLFGVLLMLLRGELFLLLLGVFFILLPLLRVILVEEHGKQLRRELPKMLMGVALITLSLAEWERTTLLVLGIAVIACSILYFVRGMIVLHIRFTASEPMEAEFRELDHEEKNEKGR